MHSIYMLIFRTSNKKYIGLTQNNVIFRLKQHIKLAMNGGQTHLSRAIRKYGPSDIEIKILEKVEKRSEANEREKYYIKLFNTIKDGYNIASGGDGGNTTIGMSKKRLQLYIKRKKIASYGERNPKYCGKTDKEIIEIAVKYFIEKKKLIRNHWQKFSKENNLPQHYSKYRFNGNGYKGFLEAIKKELTNKKISFSEQDFLLSYEERYKNQKY